MKRLLGILAIALVLAVPLATAEPIGLTAGVKASTGDLLGGFSPSVKPYVDYTVGSTGFYVGASWLIPVIPFGLGTLDAYEEYDFSAVGFDFAVGNYNSFDLPFANLYGCIYGTAAYGLPFGLTPKVELDVNYYSTFGLDGYVFLNYKTDLGPGKLGAEARLYAPLVPAFSLDNLRCRLNYTMPVGPVNVKGEVEPTLVLSSFAMKLAVSVYVSMDL
jgi:hypothetical protein